MNEKKIIKKYIELFSGELLSPSEQKERSEKFVFDIIENILFKYKSSIDFFEETFPNIFKKIIILEIIIDPEILLNTDNKTAFMIKQQREMYNFIRENLNIKK